MFSSISKGDDSDDDFGPIRNQARRRDRRAPSPTGLGFDDEDDYYYMEPRFGGGVSPDMQALVIDLGTGMTKCGFSGDDAPRAVFPTIVGRPKRPDIMVGMDAKDCFVGDEAQAKRGILNLKNPIKRGHVTDWMDMEKIFHHTFYNELRVTPEEHPTIITEPFMTLKQNREKMTSVMFETFNVPAFYLMSQEVLSLYASGRTTGVVVMSGEGFTTAVPVFESSPFDHTSWRGEYGGQEITKYLVKLLCDRGLEMTTSAEREIVRDIKEKLGYISLDLEAEEKEGKVVEYELPDGTKMEIKGERFRAPELLFNPSLFGTRVGEKGVQHGTIESIEKCDKDVKNELYKNIVLSGGSTMFPGIIERLATEMKNIMKGKILEKKKKEVMNNIKDLKINAPAERKFSVWIGASILSSLSTFSRDWITKDDYDDSGANIIHQKCSGWTQYYERPLFHQELEEDRTDRLEFVIENYFVGEEYAFFDDLVVKLNVSKKRIFVPKILM